MDFQFHEPSLPHHVRGVEGIHGGAVYPFLRLRRGITTEQQAATAARSSAQIIAPLFLLVVSKCLISFQRGGVGSLVSLIQIIYPFMVYRHLGLPCRKSKVGTHDDMDSDWRPLHSTGNKPPSHFACRKQGEGTGPTGTIAW